MKRNLLIGGILALVAVFVWSAGKFTAVPLSAPAATPGLPPACEACALATQAALTQENINLGALQALATANAAAVARSAAETPAMLKANVFWAQVAFPSYRWEADTLATASARDVSRSARQIETDRQRAWLRLTLGAPTQNADANAAQLKMDQVISGTTAVIAIAGLQAHSDITGKPEPSTVLWMGLTPILIIAAAVLTLWGVSRWQAQRRSGGRSATPR
jgi:hypothetical protein